VYYYCRLQLDISFRLIHNKADLSTEINLVTPFSVIFVVAVTCTGLSFISLFKTLGLHLFSCLNFFYFLSLDYFYLHQNLLL
jgi:hypothetical protein